MTLKVTAQVFLALQIITTFIPFIVFVITVSTVAALIGLLFTRYFYISLAYLVWLIYDEFWVKTSSRDGRLIQFVRNLAMWRILASYFPVRLYKTIDLDPSENYIFAAAPHGYFGHGYISSIATEACGFSKLFPGINHDCVTIDSFFKWPFLRELLISCGSRSVKADSIEYKLKMGPGHSIYMNVGGVEEMFLSRLDDYYLYINKRKGFIRLALKTGATIVPVFQFGEHCQFKLGEWRKGSSGYWFAIIVDKLWTVKLPNIIGRWTMFWGAIPFGKPMNHVVGAPLKFDKAELEKTCKDEREMVDICHAMYLSAMRKLFDDNKARFGESDRQLIFT